MLTSSKTMAFMVVGIADVMVYERQLEVESVVKLLLWVVQPVLELVPLMLLVPSCTMPRRHRYHAHITVS